MLLKWTSLVLQALYNAAIGGGMQGRQTFCKKYSQTICLRLF